ncbi:kinesin-like protein KIF17 isoform X2 [Zonotrichia albicollis]|uniref:kinesin-like protein KIF17 isoform X2 n=1 Tax=Zonotrichia albicollis TaxID=44394 RepID=UPI003D81143A
MAAEPVKVAVRCRPLSGREAALGHRAIVHRRRGQRTGPVPGAEPRGFRPASPGSSPSAGSSALSTSTVRSLPPGGGSHGRLQWHHLCLWQWESFTMQGAADSASQKGIIPRVFEHIFESVQRESGSRGLLAAVSLPLFPTGGDGVSMVMLLELGRAVSRGFSLLGLLTWSKSSSLPQSPGGSGSREAADQSTDTQTRTISDHTPSYEDAVAAAHEEPTSAQAPSPLRMNNPENLWAILSVKGEISKETLHLDLISTFPEWCHPWKDVPPPGL